MNWRCIIISALENVVGRGMCPDEDWEACGVYPNRRNEGMRVKIDERRTLLLSYSTVDSEMSVIPFSYV